MLPIPKAASDTRFQEKDITKGFPMSFKTVTAAIIFDGSKVLIARRAPAEKLAGFWEFPGGKLESGETLKACLSRELKEELNIDTQVFEILAESEYHYEHGFIKLIGMRTEITGGTITTKVHDKIEWAEIAHLLNYPLAPADIPIAKTLQNQMKDKLPVTSK